MTLPQYIGSSIFAHNTSTDELTASQDDFTSIPKWLEILEGNPTKLAMFAATQLRWVPSFIEGVEDSEKIYSGEISSLTFNGRGVIADQVLVQVLSVLAQACHEPFEGLLGKPSNIELANEKTRRAVIRYSDEVFIEFKIGENNTITAQAQGMSSFNFPQQEVLRQIKEHGSRFMSSTGLVLSARPLEEAKAKRTVLIRDELFDAIMKAVQDTMEHSQEEKEAKPNKDVIEESPTDAPYQFSETLCNTALNCVTKGKSSRDFTLLASTALLSLEKGARINCSPYLLGKMINQVYSVRDSIDTQMSTCAA